MPAHPTLIKYATRVYDEVPGEQKLHFDIVEENVKATDVRSSSKICIEEKTNYSLILVNTIGDILFPSKQPRALEHWYNTNIDALGQYKTQIIAL